jgi:hypothetical protein
MKRLITPIITFPLSLSAVYGMGCKTKPESCPSGEHKVLPESTKACSPALVSVPVKPIEGAGKDNTPVEPKAMVAPTKKAGGKPSADNPAKQTKKKTKGRSSKKARKNGTAQKKSRQKL